MQVKIPSDFKKIKTISSQILQDLKEKQLSAGFLFDVRLACEEAMINAIKYGNNSDASKTVSIEWDITEEGIVIAIEDEGAGFDYRQLPDPTENENLFKNKGRGLFLIQKLMDKVEFNVKGNRIIMSKFFPKKHFL